jgi:hypothetical protein
LGSLTFGQTKDIVIPMSINQYKTLKIILDYESPHGEKKKQCESITKLNENEKQLNQQKHRLELVHLIRKNHEYARNLGATFTDNDPNISADIQSLEEKIKNHSTDDKYLTDLLADLTGQVKQALSRSDWFKKWGTHYLPSIARRNIYS